MFTPYLMFADIAAGRTEYVLMQSTGLADKDGQEIFEGDVLGGRGFVVTWSSKIFSNGCFDQAIGFCIPEGGNFQDVKVIGNIYANPELATWRKET